MDMTGRDSHNSLSSCLFVLTRWPHPHYHYSVMPQQEPPKADEVQGKFPAGRGYHRDVTEQIRLTCHKQQVFLVSLWSS